MTFSQAVLALSRQRQPGLPGQQSKFQDSLSYTEKPCLGVRGRVTFIAHALYITELLFCSLQSCALGCQHQGFSIPSAPPVLSQMKMRLCEVIRYPGPLLTSHPIPSKPLDFINQGWPHEGPGRLPGHLSCRKSLCSPLPHCSLPTPPPTSVPLLLHFSSCTLMQDDR